MSKPTVFISYSHKDEVWKDRLVTHLAVLQNQGLLDLWDDHRIGAGADWEQEIRDAMAAASVAILLVSANFLTSQFILGEEVPRLLERRDKEGLRIFPVVIRPCTWKQVAWLARMQLRPKDGRPLSAGNEHQIDSDLAAIASEVYTLLRSTGPPPEEEPLVSRPSRLFPFLSAYEIADADYFCGRDRESEQLVNHIRRDPVVVLYGPSGLGKSSLIKAGVMPRLQKLGFQVIYAPVFENILQDVEDEVERLLGTDEAPENYVEALHKMHDKSPEQHIVLIVDQFERALRDPHKSPALEGFFGGISRLVHRADRFATIVIVVREDWTYYLELATRDYPDLPLNRRYFYILYPLDRQSAREAIVRPLQAQSIPFDGQVIDAIVAGLWERSDGLSVDYGIKPIELQIVLHALFSEAERQGTPQQALTMGIFQQQKGVESILTNYLVECLANRTEAWRLLALFVDQDGKTGQIIRRPKLLAVPAADDVGRDLLFLIRHGFVEVYEEIQDRKREVCYRLAHDYLVDAIVAYLNENPGQREWRLAVDWLTSGTAEWLSKRILSDNGSTQRSVEDEFLLEQDRYLHIYSYRDILRLEDESRGLLIRTALRYGHAGLGYWLFRGANKEDDVQIVADRLLSVHPEVQQAARDAISGCTRPSQETATVLEGEARRSLSDRLRKALHSPAESDERDAAAEALWTLQAFHTFGEHCQVGGIVLRRWLQDHLLQIASYIFLGLFILTLGGSVWYVREKLRGSWELVRSLRAGATPLVVADPGASDTIYALTLGDYRSHEGTSLFMQEGEGRWNVCSRNFSRRTPTSLVVVHSDAASRFYVSLYARGILRSGDGGQTWELANRGLPSYALTSMVANPDAPGTLYVATNDWRGVLMSTDGADTWGFYDYDYGDEIYGAAISKLTYTRANGGTLIAGTTDGRILWHRSGVSGWELRSNLAKGGITALVVGGEDGTYIYAGTDRGIVLRSQDGGETWRALGQISSTQQVEFKITAMAVIEDAPARLYVGAYGNGGYTIWESQDMGQNWEMVPGIGLPRSQIYSIVVDGPKPYRLVVGTVDGLFASRDGGNNWEKEPLDAPLASVNTVALSAKHRAPVYAAVAGSIYVNEGSIYHRPDDDQVEWVHGKGLNAETVRTIVVDPDNPRIAYAGVFVLGEWSVFITRDGGKTWRQTASPPIEPIVPDTMALALARARDGKTVLYAGTTGCGVLRTADEGNSWDTFGRTRCDQDMGTNMPSDVSFLAAGAGGPDEIYAAAGQHIHYSQDGGVSWRRRELAIDSSITGVVADSLAPGTVYLITASDGFWRSQDGGLTWQRRGNRIFNEVELTAIAAVPSRVGDVIVGASNGGVWRTRDGGLTWRFVRENLVISHVTSIATSEALEGEILVGSLSDGIALFSPGRLFRSSH